MRGAIAHMGVDMALWEKILDFGDPYAEQNQFTDETSGAKFAEVIYGGRDADDEPCKPADDPKGIGRWVAIERDGGYELLLWKHDRKSGGKTEYGSGITGEPLEQIHEVLVKKVALVKKAEALLADERRDGAALRAMNALMDEWKAIHGFRTPREDELWNAFQAARTKFREERNAVMQSMAKAKEELAQQAEAVAEAKDFRNGSARMRELMDQWRNLSSAGRQADEALWTRFNGARQAFFDAQHENYERRQAKIAENAAAKEDLIKRAQELSDAKDYSREATAAMRALGDKWKATGFAGKEINDQLWERFRSAQNPFWDERKKYNERRHAEWEQRHAEWCERMEGVLAAKQRTLDKLEEQVDVLEYQLKATDDDVRRRDLTERLEEYQRDITDIENDMANIRRKMKR